VSITDAKWKTALGSGTGLTGGWSATYTDSKGARSARTLPKRR
jgi:hypothetical protein